MNTTSSSTGAASGGFTGPRRSRKKICRFCADHQLIIDYKEAKLLLTFINERGKMAPRRVTGNCAFHQRRLQDAIKRARILALLPYTTVYQQF